MKKQTFYLLSMTLTLIATSVCTSCQRIMGGDDDMIEVDEISLIETRNKQLDILNNAFDVKDEITPTTNAVNKNDTVDVNVRNKRINDSIRFTR